MLETRGLGDLLFFLVILEIRCVCRGIIFQSDHEFVKLHCAEKKISTQIQIQRLKRIEICGHKDVFYIMQ